jgi:hypothetical protein
VEKKRRHEELLHISSFEKAGYFDIINHLISIDKFSGHFRFLNTKMKEVLEGISYNGVVDEQFKDLSLNSFLAFPIKTENYRERFLKQHHKVLAEKVSVHYIGSFRANSKRLYSNQHQGTDFNELLLDIHRVKLTHTKPFVQKWLKKFNIGDDIKYNWIKGVATEVKIEKGEKSFDLVDLGFGITQPLPIILKIALIVEQGHKSTYKVEGEVSEAQIPYGRLKRNELSTQHVVLLEEPESNLHPNFQSKLADFLWDASKTFDIQFIIETHSEYLIRKFQYLVAKEEIRTNDLTLYYFYHPDLVPINEPQVKKIDFLENGTLSHKFGSGFFDEADNLAIDLFNFNRNKRHAKP